MCEKKDAELRQCYSCELHGRKPLAILLNVPGQQYTLGSTYPGLEEKVEFIVCHFPRVEQVHCKITVNNDGEFWIQNICAQAETYINGSALQKKCLKLNFGDKISLGVENPTNSIDDFYLAHLAHFTFEERDPGISRHFNYYPRNTFSDIAVKDISFQEVTPGAVQNELVLHNIFKYFWSTELFRLRFVCRTWNAVASEILRKRTVVSLGFTGHSDQTKFFCCLHETKWQLPRGLFLEIPMLIDLNDGNDFTEVWRNEELYVSGSRAGVKFQDDLHHYLEERCSFENLRIKIRFTRLGLEFQVLDSVLKKLSKNLQHLRLDVQIKSQPPNFSEDWELRKLKSFAVFGGKGRNNSQFAKNIVNKITSLETFSCKTSQTIFLKKIVERNFPNLRSISVGLVKAAHLRCLKQITAPLETLKISTSDFHYSEREAEELLPQVLEIHSGSLKYLTLDCFQGRILLPCFKKLQSLTFTYSELTDVEFTSFNHAVYEMHFPTLKELTLQLPYSQSFIFHFYDATTKVFRFWDVNQRTFDAFFPNESNQVCNSLVKLNMACLPDNGGTGRWADEMYCEKIRIITTLFPNVKEKWLQEG